MFPLARKILQNAIEHTRQDIDTFITKAENAEETVNHYRTLAAEARDQVQELEEALNALPR